MTTVKETIDSIQQQVDKIGALNRRTTVISPFTFLSLALLLLNGIHAINIPWTTCLLPVGVEVVIVTLGMFVVSALLGGLLAMVNKLKDLP